MKKLVDEIKNSWKTLTLVFLTAITFLSLMPADVTPSAPGTDKVHHFIAYAMLMLPIALRKPANWIIWGLFFILCSGAIELIQPLVNRYAEWMDMLANSSGVVCGVIIARLINLIIKERSDETDISAGLDK